ncbi:MAG: TauD/TfdA family dioxygenase [bacterium]|nr:taurine catabolism dioxygenase TauD [Deltaproteobacteria bacterium]MCP4908015.1 TauD/TfdA family dioxygenase [bacterium]
MTFETQPLNTGVGLEILGLDLSRPIPEATRRDLYDAWLDAGILLFRGLGTSPERQLALSRCFGELDIHPVESVRIEGRPEIIRLANRGNVDPIVHYLDDQEIAGLIPWHTDMIYMTRPCRGALLRMIETPGQLGQTGWIDTVAAYDALSEEMKQRIQGLEVRFDFVLDICDMRFGRPENLRHGTMGTVEFGEIPPVVHPMVWDHPESGHKALMLSPVHLIEVVGMDRAEADPLLEELVAHSTEERFQYIHEWEVDDMVLWDNWRTLHMAAGTVLGTDREVQRTSISGDYEMGRLL